MSPNHQLSFSQEVRAPEKQVYRAFTNSTDLREWLCDEASAVARTGGRIYLWWNDGYYSSGEYQTLEPEEEISFTWQAKEDPAPSLVKVRLSKRDEGTLIELEHSGLESGDGRQETIAEMQKAWESSLKNLASVLETGEDLRFVNRPMLGITLDDFNAEVAEKLGVPVKKGIRIDGVVDGMGAQAAGLQADDVMVGLARQEVSDWPTLTNALQRFQAGDEVDVTFYRGPEKRTVKMALSRRPLPEIPETPATLAEQVEKKYKRMEAALDDFFTGVSEEQAAHIPAPDMWSAKDTLAHLIHGERGWHTWMTDLVGGFEPFYDDWSGNLQVRIDATVKAYPTIAELREELRRNCAETVAFLAGLPEAFMDRKGSYWRLAYNMLDAPYHFNAHLDQMRSAVESARQQ
jgi:uncharacterized protein YndB with AHSA1/START domain